MFCTHPSDMSTPRFEHGWYWYVVQDHAGRVDFVFGLVSSQKYQTDRATSRSTGILKQDMR